MEVEAVFQPRAICRIGQRHCVDFEYIKGHVAARFGEVFTRSFSTFERVASLEKATRIAALPTHQHT